LRPQIQMLDNENYFLLPVRHLIIHKCESCEGGRAFAPPSEITMRLIFNAPDYDSEKSLWYAH
jgi:hypothetical protein